MLSDQNDDRVIRGLTVDSPYMDCPTDLILAVAEGKMYDISIRSIFSPQYACITFDESLFNVGGDSHHEVRHIDRVDLDDYFLMALNERLLEATFRSTHTMALIQ